MRRGRGDLQSMLAGLLANIEKVFDMGPWYLAPPCSCRGRCQVEEWPPLKTMNDSVCYRSSKQTVNGVGPCGLRVRDGYDEARRPKEANKKQ